LKEDNILLNGTKKITDFLGKVDKKKKTTQAIAAITGMSMAAVLGAMTLYDSFFPRYERPEYSVYPGVYNYEIAKEYVKRDEFYYSIGDIKLKGYFYPTDNSKGLVVVVHGLHAGADDYLPIIIYLVHSVNNSCEDVHIKNKSIIK